MPFVYSTLTCDNIYAGYDQRSDASAHNLVKKVLIKGGSNVADKHFITKYGVMTEVSVEDLAFLQKDSIFQLHVKNGFITFRDRRAADPEVVAADMEGRDESAPLVDEDFDEDTKPVTTAPAKTSKKGR